MVGKHRVDMLEQYGILQLEGPSSGMDENRLCHWRRGVDHRPDVETQRSDLQGKDEPRLYKTLKGPDDRPLPIHRTDRRFLEDLVLSP